MNNNITTTEAGAFDAEAVKGLLCTAFEGGAGYWAEISEYKLADGLRMIDFRDGGKFQGETYWHPCQIIPLVDGCSVIVRDAEGDDEWTLNLEAIKDGLNIMKRKYPRHFGDFVSGNDDAETGDVFLQCCLLKDIVFG